MLQRVILGSLGTGLALWIAVQSQQTWVRMVAVMVSSGYVSFSITLALIEQHRATKNREAAADAYLLLLQQAHQRSHYRPQRPVACRGCRHYHGASYGGNLLVCGMHPYGVETDFCTDWEAK